MLASYYTNDEERGRAMGNALGGLALGVMGIHLQHICSRQALHISLKNSLDIKMKVFVDRVQINNCIGLCAYFVVSLSLSKLLTM